MRHYVSRFAFVGIVVSCMTGSSAGASRLDVHLAFSPGKNPVWDKNASATNGWHAQPVYVKDAIDERNDNAPSENGFFLGTTEHAASGVISTRDTVTRWLTESIKYALSLNGVAIAGSLPAICVEPAVKRLAVAEKNTYRGDLSVEFRVYNAKGAVLWTKTLTDSSSYWGRSHSEENVLGSMGNAMVNVCGQLMNDTSLNELLVAQPRMSPKPNVLIIRSPRDLGLRGQYRARPIGWTVFSGILAALGTADIAIAIASHEQGSSRFAGVGFLGASVVLGMVAGFKWKARFDWVDNRNSPSK
jgi:hypothetical protein